jgi:predicted nuclease with TOPRIM domain
LEIIFTDVRLLPKGISMEFRHSKLKIVPLTACLMAWVAGSSFAGVSKVIQERYRSNYENKALFLKSPIFAEKQYVYISGQTFRSEPALTGTPRFKVGDQVRVLGLDFGGDEIKFKLGPIAGAGIVELIFKFDSALQENFPNSGVFDAALAATFTEGLKYTELDDAKRTFVEQEFERAAREIATTSGTSRDTVLKYVAPRLPAYQDALHEIDSLQNRNQELGKQITQSQSENRKLESESRGQQAEIVRLRSQAASLQEKIDSSSSQLTRLGEDLRNAKGVSQNYQRELANLQRSLKIRVDTSRDLPSQIAELGQAMQKIQRDNDDLQGENGSLRANLEKAQGDDARLSGENQDLKNSVRQMKDMIATLTSKEDSLARQYILLKQAKDNLENVTLSIANLSTRLVEEKTAAGVQSGRINVFVGNILLGAFIWSFPERLNADQEKSGTASFAMESIDYVRVTPAERHVLQSLGERLKFRANLVSRTDTLEVKPAKDSSLQEVGERDRAEWNWRLVNRGSQDGRFLLAVQLVNKNGDEIPLIQSEPLILSTNLVRAARSYLQPIPIGLGAVLGSLIVCIAGLFRRSRRAATARAGSLQDQPYSGRKQL